ncbi:hypothetical protein [Kribbella sp. NPDC051718]|uniref:hypothetical protein n=1 Tax=Kribbella sp. NPDC051718 TaxID=3155168 RepID=UPI00341CC7D7
MASWEELRSYIRITYKVAEDDGTILRLLFAVGEGRTQIVVVGQSKTNSGAEFATIASPFAEVGQVEIDSVLSSLADYVVGGAVAYGQMYMLRHSVPLADLDPDEFDGPLRMVLSTADELEAKFVGSDRF